jgi:hypothetical protein
MRQRPSLPRPANRTLLQQPRMVRCSQLKLGALDKLQSAKSAKAPAPAATRYDDLTSPK